jgi:hypothetical protein
MDYRVREIWGSHSGTSEGVGLPCVFLNTCPENEGTVILQMPVAIYQSSSMDCTGYVKSSFEKQIYEYIWTYVYK